MPALTTHRADLWLMAKVASILAVVLLAIAAQPVDKQPGSLMRERYLSPVEMALSADGRQLYVVCQDSDEVRCVDLAAAKVVARVPVGHVPRGIALSPDNRQIYITNAWSDTVSVIDAATLKVVQTLPTGFEPAGIVVDRSGKTVYVANRLSGDISVIDLITGQQTKPPPPTHIYPN